MSKESGTTVKVALAANLAIALAKTFAGVMAGSAAMLAEAAHSFADTTNQAFLMVSLGLGSRPPDTHHPFGYGKERFFWAFMAAIFIFVSGAVFSIGQGVIQYLAPPEGGSSEFVASYAVLGFAFIAEGVSWARALRQTRAGARAAGKHLFRYVRESRDPTVKTVLSEDSAALAGLVLAFLGVGLHQLTGDHRFDAVASIAIGILLGIVAFALGRDTKGLLLGEAAHPEEVERIRRVIEEPPEVERVVELLTMAMGPEHVLVAAKLDLADGVPAGRVEEICAQIDARLRHEVPSVRNVFLDPTAPHEPTSGIGTEPA